MTLTPWPAHGTEPWDTTGTLKGYIDDRDAALQTQIDAIGTADSSLVWAEHPNFSTPQDALDAAVAGDTIIFTENHTLSGGDVYTVPVSGVTIISAKGVVLTQTVWAKPVFDVLSVDSVTITATCVFSGTRGDAAVPAPFRGEAGYLYGAAVWSNGNDCEFNITATGFTCGVYLSCWDGAALTAYKKNNRVDIVCDDVDFGVNWLGQEDLVVAVTARDIVTTTNGGPPHAIYGSGNNTLRSRRVLVERAICSNNPDSNAFQIKYCDGLSIPSMVADTSAALFNFVDITDTVIGEGVLTATSGDQTVLGDFQRINAAKNNDISVGRLILHQQSTVAADFFQCLSVVGSDVSIGSVMIETTVTDAVTATACVYLNGTNIAVGELQIHNTGFGTVPVSIGENAATDQVTIRRIKTRNATNGIAYVDDDATNVLLQYAPNEIVGLNTATSYTVRVVNGTDVGYITDKAPYERFWSISGGSIAGSKKPEPHLETVTHYKITDGSAYTIGAPGDTYPWVGMTHDIAIENASGGSLGAITWNAAYSLNGSFTNPANGYTSVVRFRWNGTVWAQVEFDGPTATGPTAWTNVTFAGSWANYGGSDQACQYRKNGDVVEIRGSIKSGTGTIFTLPVGFRPPANHNYICSSNNGYDIAYVIIGTAGTVALGGFNAGGNNSFISLDQISFSITS